jgi:hypothetical protein
MLLVDVIPLVLGIIALMVIMIILIYIGYARLSKISSFKQNTTALRSKIRIRKLNRNPNDKEDKLAILAFEEY